MFHRNSIETCVCLCTSASRCWTIQLLSVCSLIKKTLAFDCVSVAASIFDRELSEDIAYYFNYPSTEQEEEKERSSWCLSTLMYRFVGHVVTVDPCTRGKVPNTTLPLNEARSLELQSNRASEASLGGSNGIE